MLTKRRVIRVLVAITQGVLSLSVKETNIMQPLILRKSRVRCLNPYLGLYIGYLLTWTHPMTYLDMSRKPRDILAQSVILAPIL